MTAPWSSVANAAVEPLGLRRGVRRLPDASHRHPSLRTPRARTRQSHPTRIGARISTERLPLDDQPTSARIGSVWRATTRVDFVRRQHCRGPIVLPDPDRMWSESGVDARYRPPQRSPRKSGRSAIDPITTSGTPAAEWRASGRNFPVRTRIPVNPIACAPRTSLSMSSPIIAA